MAEGGCMGPAAPPWASSDALVGDGIVAENVTPLPPGAACVGEGRGGAGMVAQGDVLEPYTSRTRRRRASVMPTGGCEGLGVVVQGVNSRARRGVVEGGGAASGGQYKERIEGGVSTGIDDEINTKRCNHPELYSRSWNPTCSPL